MLNNHGCYRKIAKSSYQAIGTKDVYHAVFDGAPNASYGG